MNVVNKLLPLQEAEATQTMFELLQDPEGYYDHIRRYTTAVILASVYGQRGKRFDSPNVQALYHAQDQFTAVLEQGASPPVDAFPFLKMLPEFLAPWKRRARAVRKEQKSLYLRLLQETRARLEAGKGGDCFLRTMLQDQEKNEMDDEHLAYLAGNLVSGSLACPTQVVAGSLIRADGSWLGHDCFNPTILPPSHDRLSERIQKGATRS